MTAFRSGFNILSAASTSAGSLLLGEGRDITRGAVEALGVQHGIAAKRIAAIIEYVLPRGARLQTKSGVSASKAEIGDRLAAINAVFA